MFAVGCSQAPLDVGSWGNRKERRPPIPIRRNQSTVKANQRPKNFHLEVAAPPYSITAAPPPSPLPQIMLFKTRSAAVYGIEAYLVDVEVNISTGGNGQVVIVGLPDTAVRESRNRVLPAIRNNGFGAPYQKIVINLGPADVKKEGSAFDLPMAIGILGGYGLLAKQDVSDYLMVGELTLDGKLCSVKGVLSIAMLARDRKIPHLLVSVGNAQEVAVVEGVVVYLVCTLTEVVEFVNGIRFIDSVRSENQPVTQESHRRHEDFRDVRGQYHAKRAIEVAM